MAGEDDRRFTIIALIVLAVVFAVASGLFILLRGETLFDVGVTDSGSPDELIVSNITPFSATISWYSETPQTGFVSYGTERTEIDRTEIDTLDESEDSQQPRRLHYVELTGLQQNTQYFFTVTSGETTYTNGSSFEFTTLPISEDIATPDPLLISLPQGYSDSIVYAHGTDGTTSSEPVSVRTTQENISLDSSRFVVEDGSSLELESVQLFARNSAGEATSYAAEISEETSVITMDNGIIAQVFYNPEAPIVIAQEPIVQPDPEPSPQPEPEPTPISEPDPVLPPTGGEPPLPEPEPAPAPTSPPVALIPDTAIDGALLSSIGAILGGGISIFFGISLIRGKQG